MVKVIDTFYHIDSFMYQISNIYHMSIQCYTCCTVGSRQWWNRETTVRVWIIHLTSKTVIVLCTQTNLTWLFDSQAIGWLPYNNINDTHDLFNVVYLFYSFMRPDALNPRNQYFYHCHFKSIITFQMMKHNLAFIWTFLIIIISV